MGALPEWVQNEGIMAGKKGMKMGSKLLHDIRKVSQTREGPRDTEQQRWLRKMKDDNPEKFFDKIMQAEKDHQQRVAKKVEQPAIAEEPVERCEEVVDELMREWNGKESPEGSGG